MNLSRNQYGYRDPTAEKAITHIMSEQKRKERRRSWRHEQSKGLPETGSVVRQ